MKQLLRKFYEKNRHLMIAFEMMEELEIDSRTEDMSFSNSSSSSSSQATRKRMKQGAN